MNGSMLTVSNSDFGKLDILLEDGKELFPATECARMLGYSQPGNAVRTHCHGGVKRTVIDSKGRKQIANFIPEGDVWRLIIRSRLPKAQQFEKWLFDEVLPEIRRTGGYRAAWGRPAAPVDGARVHPHRRGGAAAGREERENQRTVPGASYGLYERDRLGDAEKP